MNARIAAAFFGLALLAGACAKPSSSGTRTPGSSGSSAPEFHPHVAAEIELGRSDVPRLGVSLAAGLGALWIGVQNESATEGWIDRVDPATNEVVREIPVPGSPSIATGFGYVWALVNRGTAAIDLFRFDPTSSGLQSTTSFGPEWVSVGPIAVGAGAIWIGAERAGSPLLLRVDPDTGQIQREIAVPWGIADIELGEGAVWLSVGRGIDTVHDLVRVDPGTDEVTASVRVGARPGGIAVGAGSVWASLAVGVNPNAYWDTPAAAQSVDASTGQLLGDPVPLEGGFPDPLNGPSGPFAVAEGGLWVGGYDKAERHFVVARLNLETMQIDHGIGVPAYVMGNPIFDSRDQAIWVSHGESVFRVDLR